MPPQSKKMKQRENAVVEELTALYQNKLLPIEKKYLYHKFHAPEILPSELSAKPQILLLGQYSTGKTSFIRKLIGCDYPGIHIGPEPTTDKFVAVCHGDAGKVIKGNAVTAVSDLPFAGLTAFGGFLNKFEAALTDSPVLKDVTIIDTPGVLSGEKQRLSRGYDFAETSRWFAERSDLILLLFDSYKLDISDEFKGVIENLKGHDDKVHCVLNKADALDPESLMKVYGALLWSMAKIMKGAEVPRVYCGSFKDDTLLRDDFEALFQKDSEALMSHLAELPKLCGMRKINEMVKRIRLNIANYCLVTYLKSQMPMLWGHEAKQKYLMDNLDDVYKKVAYQYNLSDADFPNIEEFRGKLQKTMFSTFPKPDRATLTVMSDMLSTDIPQIFKSIAGVTSTSEREKNAKDDDEDGEGDQNLKAMMNFDLNTLNHYKEDDNTASIVSALVFVFMVVLLAFLFKGGHLDAWVKLVIEMKQRLLTPTTATAEPSL
mmetsp:Transcript_18256/g.30443  ORF Transcript_18256/g.30443 Transcript_18256/m.30443 type:complete len:488 (-) Transcript_18256:220-1683(-)|eukprot:CAMPEP_0114418306 /NCGR_PEP_ID=MMETSP0103-20121206/3426_1 /TAXON_ID=37642 ORGANISM="Paraphysomonas imperforata, Strain PA2" /NCGR_SAMPLE_ID=MMETSP0103 /ASSEMBLY_ACC=CAM_ASM_000201 /LENGTH=487 /DNA_ID=CAMNT_0001586655 /DNA_START=53 /DNA_END=1516 /DNA_ORIENTATION=-